MVVVARIYQEHQARVNTCEQIVGQAEGLQVLPVALSSPQLRQLPFKGIARKVQAHQCGPQSVRQ